MQRMEQKMKEIPENLIIVYNLIQFNVKSQATFLMDIQWFFAIENYRILC